MPVSDIHDAAFYTGIALIGHAVGGPLPAGVLLLAASLTLAALSAGGNDE